MVEGARLESVYRGNSIEGSNPSLSASKQGSTPMDTGVAPRFVGKVVRQPLLHLDAGLNRGRDNSP